ncbi:MAG: hypothetical protein GU355_07910 [Caldivirga sp.]|uniref:hypothetical protein n=1 Tax=Caldivirga sp. MU80 TaxID=1650354 RepID=UPI000749B2C4|nr:hypothetical protein [Caldivirga sp. MU80]KUO89144.1 MAG: hypothetical protein AT712_00030 [Caldivirga sp. CIS_19]NAZ29199.1 hypothetical protein [Caldivirga sp.]
MVAFTEAEIKDYVKVLNDRVIRLRELTTKVSSGLTKVNTNPSSPSVLRFEGNEIYIVNGSDEEQLAGALRLILELADLQEKVYSLVGNDLNKVIDENVKVAVVEPLGLPTRILLVPSNVTNNK